VTINTAIRSCGAEQCELTPLSRRGPTLFVRLLASLVFLSVISGAQTPAAQKSDSQADGQPRTSSGANATSEHAIKLDLPTTPAALPPGVEKIGNGVSAPVAIKTPQAKYTREARKQKIEGACLVAIVVNAKGIPQNLKVVRPLGYGLDEAALAAVKKYRFKPAMKDGHQVPVAIMIEVNFKLS
jgi:TonB family protein